MSELAICPSFHAGYYLTGIGLLSVLAQERPDAKAWWQGRLHCDLHPDAIVEILCRRAQANDWRASTERAYHPLFAQWGRREPHRWQPYAREHLRTMGALRRAHELRALLEGESFLVTPPPRKWQGKPVGESARRAFGLGTIFPMTKPDLAGSGLGASISAWHAVLAWESWSWLSRSTNSMRDYAWSADPMSEELKRWLAVTWDRPVELRRVPLLWTPRWRQAGSAWSDWLRGDGCSLLRPFGRLQLYAHRLVQTEGSKTAEAYGGDYQSGLGDALARRIEADAVDDEARGIAAKRCGTIGGRLRLFRDLRECPEGSSWGEWVERPYWLRRWYVSQVGLAPSFAEAEEMPREVRAFLARRGIVKARRAA